MKGKRVSHPWASLGRRPIAATWSPEDHARLVELAGKLTPAEIGALLGRTATAIRSRAKLYDLKTGTVHPNRRWKAEEEKFLRDNHKRLTIGQMANALGRSHASVNMKTHAMGLDCRLTGDKNHATVYAADDVELSRALFDAGLTRKQIAEKLEVPYERVVAWISFSSRIS